MLLPQVVKDIWDATSSEHPTQFINHELRNDIVCMKQAGIFKVSEDEDRSLWVSRTDIGQSIVDAYLIQAGIHYLLQLTPWKGTPYPKNN